MTGLSLGPVCAPSDHAELCARLAFEHHKCDLHVSDRPTVSPSPLFIAPAAWGELRADAEALWREAVQTERVLFETPSLLRMLALPRALRREIVRAAREQHAPAARFVRIDFHPTPDGWRVSEMNSDVPGGFHEASALDTLFLERLPGAQSLGDPCAALTDALASSVPPGSTVALIHATAFSDDHQSMLALARRLEARAVEPLLLAPDQIVQRAGALHARSEHAATRPIAAAARFFPAEWLPNLPSRSDWSCLVSDRALPMLNPASAVVTQSKRWPLLWPEIPCDLPAWKRLLPVTRDPRHCPDLKASVLKPALGRVGDAIYLPADSPLGERRAPRLARRFPRHWIAQDKFRTLPIDSPSGPLYPCVGVFVLDGRVVGAYGRLGRTPLIDHHAQDAPVLLAPQAGAAAA